jgi:hypothetical protein
MTRQINPLTEAMSQNGLSTLTVSTSIKVGDQAIEHAKTLAVRLPDESFIADTIRLIIDEIFAELIEKVQNAELTTGSALFNLSAELKIGEASSLVERKPDDAFSLETLSNFLVTVAERLAGTLIVGLHDFKTEIGLVWDDQSFGYMLGHDSAYRAVGGDDVGSMLAALLGVRTYGSRVFVIGLGGELDEVPSDAYRCNGCGELHSVSQSVEFLQAIQQDGRIPEEYATSLPIAVLNAFARAQGGYWNTETQAVQQIPEDRYPDGAGALADIPVGMTWNPETYSLEPVKPDSDSE